MKTYAVVISPKARDEIEATLAFLKQNLPASADRWYQRLRESVASLQSLPERCPLAPENEWYDGELRQLLQGKRPHVYRILFEVREASVAILRVRHGRQDLLQPEELIDDKASG